MAFSSRYQFSGHIEIDGTEYTVKFSSYDDLNKLIDGTYKSKASFVDIYKIYTKAIRLEARTYFSPVITKEKGRCGQWTLLGRGDTACVPYLVMSIPSPGRIEVDLMAMDFNGESTRLKTLTTKPGGIVMRMGAKMRWVWRRTKVDSETNLTPEAA
ncbi:hypothetical protein amb2193 [Paramagnetospirillum magneticum AMB-1]|uniref:Uncharacterized protein n=1 Tax=Paramagnetospirillum magneticum (strain ATCC 700264 / AMB-1) TaxID=342108 RepID=Q2W578_PARM1|nr:hypothetical protein amb2193 [Paramagnetospirillum magneticum AMB-1]